jgi:hypothetical protein
MVTLCISSLSGRQLQVSPLLRTGRAPGDHLKRVRMITKWERVWERTLLAAARWCSAALAPARL